MQREASLEQFDLHEIIGTGGSGTVWRATYAFRDDAGPQTMPVAIKVLSKRDPNESRRMLRHEVQAIARLNHPGIVRVLDFGLTPDHPPERIPPARPFLVMELLEGQSLVESLGKLRWSRARRILFELLEALGHAHAHGIVHLDVKPENVLLCGPDRRVKLVDFGIARTGGRDPSNPSPVFGTAPFMAPEQVLGRHADLGPWTDLYAVGCTAWALLTGTPPFRGPRRRIYSQHLSAPLPPLVPRAPVPGRTREWLEFLLEKSIGGRFACAGDALAMLGEMKSVASGVIQVATTHQRIRRTADATVSTSAPEEIEPDAPVVTRHSRPPAGPPALPEAPPTAERVPPPVPGLGASLSSIRTWPLVGRGDQERALWQALRAVVTERSPRVVFLEGPVGAGKTRLGEWLGQCAVERGAVRELVVTHGPVQRPAHGLEGLLARQLDLIGLPADALEARVLAVLSRTGPVTPSEVQGLLRVVRPTATRGDTTGGFLLPEQRFAVITRYLRRLTDERALLLRLEDVQWGPDSLAFCEHLLAADAPLPVLVVATRRPEAGGPTARIDRLLGHDRCARVPVDDLRADDLVALLDDAMGLDTASAERIAAVTGGNPLHAIELACEWGGSADTDAPTLEDVWTARLTRLLRDRSPYDEMALELAATLGETVDVRTLQIACTRRGIRLSPTLLDAVLDVELALPQSGPDGPSMRFVHPSLLQLLTRNARAADRIAAHHRACGDALDFIGFDPGTVGRHYAAAGEPWRALDPLVAGARARADAGDHEAADALLALHADQCRGLARGTGKSRVRALLVRCQMADVRERHEELTGLVAQASEIVDEDDLAGQAGIAIQHARLLRRLGRTHEEHAVLACAEADARLAGRPDLVAAAAVESGWACFDEGQLDRARERFQQGLEVVNDDASVRAGQLLEGLANVERARGDLPRAMDHIDRASELYERASDLRGLMSSDYWRGSVQIELGHDDAALESLERCRSLAELIGNATVQGVTLVRMGQIHLRRGALERAAALILTGIERVERAGRPSILGAVYVYALECHARRARRDAFAEHAARAEELLSQTQVVDVSVARAAERAGDAALEAGRPGDARRAYGIAKRQWASVRPDGPEARRVDAAIARVRRLRSVG